MHVMWVDLDTEAWIDLGLARLERYLAAHAEFVRRYGW
jgi:hypothetical protein